MLYKKFLHLKPCRSLIDSFLSALLVCGWIICTGCLGLAPTEDPSRFYALTSSNLASGPAADADSGLNIGLREVVLPGYQDRANIAYRKSEHEIAYLPFHEWAEPLNENILRVIGENLQHHPEVQQVYSKTWTYSDPLQVASSVKIERFEWDQSKSAVVLEGTFNWNHVVSIDQKVAPQIQPFSIHVSVSDSSNIYQNPNPVIQAMNSALLQLSDKFAAILVDNR